MTTPAPRVFVSHNSKDRSFTERLVGDLERAGAQVWWDVTGIDEGDFIAKINQALSNYEWFVLVLTPHAIVSQWVNDEMNAALHRRKQGFLRGVLPLLASPCVPGTIPPLWDTLNRFDATRDYEGALKGLLRAVGLLLPPLPTAIPPQPATAQQAPILSPHVRIRAHVAASDAESERRAVLDDLREGRITLDEAERRLSALR